MATIGPPKPQPIPCATDAQDSVEKDARVDPLFMTEAERSIEAVKNSRIVLSVEQEILAILQAQKG